MNEDIVGKLFIMGPIQTHMSTLQLMTWLHCCKEWYVQYNQSINGRIEQNSFVCSLNQSQSLVRWDSLIQFTCEQTATID